jgi:uncharacterized protein (TIGR02147 family)
MELKINNILQKQFDEKTRKNGLYSIRAFARDIGIGKSTLHEILHRDKKMSKSTCIKILDYLKVSPDEFDEILNFNLNPSQDNLFKELSAEEFSKIATCEHYALLSLAKSTTCPSDINLLSKRIVLPQQETQSLLNDLVELDLVEIKDNRLIRTAKLLTTTYDVPNKAIQNYHNTSLDKVKDALQDVEVELRDIASTMFLMSPDKMEALKEELKAIRRKLVSSVEDNNENSEAFLLNISVIPISQRSTNAH